MSEYFRVITFCFFVFLLFTGLDCASTRPPLEDIIIEEDDVLNETERCDNLMKRPIPNSLIVKVDTFIGPDIVDPEQPEITPPFIDSIKLELKERFFYNFPQVSLDTLKIKKVCGCGYLLFDGLPAIIKPEYTKKGGKGKQEDDYIQAIGSNFEIDPPVFPPPPPLLEVNPPPTDSFKIDPYPTYGEEGPPIRVAIIDSGVDYFHKDLINAIWPGDEMDKRNGCLKLDSIGYDFVRGDSDSATIENFLPYDNLGHGTHINGIIANSFSSNLDLNLINLKIFDRLGTDLFTAACAIDYADTMEVDVINLSWGFYAKEPPLILETVLDKVQKSGILVVSSVGNDSINVDCCPHWPSNFTFIHNNHIAVAAKDSLIDTLAAYSNYVYRGGRADLSALGTFISTYPDRNRAVSDSLISASGTSMAAALVTRSVAFLKAQTPEKTFLNLKEEIEGGAKSLSDSLVIHKHTKKDTWHDLDTLDIPPLKKYQQ